MVLGCCRLALNDSGDFISHGLTVSILASEQAYNKKLPYIQVATAVNIFELRVNPGNYDAK